MKKKPNIRGNNNMKKNIQIACNIISVGLIIIFILKTTINYFQYDALVNSAPFSAWILINAISLILPALIIFLIGCLVGKK